ncbi:MAG: Phosphate regulon sensor protein PhoR (SphS) [Oscillospiraceae bacterium]|nr:Phosphate regulon sensor protein PhoR (SphS) [Oscillospiraceae bacterium]
MFRSLHLKLVLIMVLLIISLMTVVGAFLINSVVHYFIGDFRDQLFSVVEDTNFYSDLEKTDSVDQMTDIMDAYKGPMGVNGRSRNYYILDGRTAKVLATSSENKTASLTITPNITSALLGSEGVVSDIAASYMDFAVPVECGNIKYIIYIYDNRESVNNLNGELFTIIIQSLVFGLAISVLLSFLLAKTMITPIEQLTDGVKRVAAGDFSRRIELAAKDEIGILTTTFNHMARRLEETIDEAQYERNKLNTLFLHMTDGVIAFSREGSVIHFNPAAQTMLHRTIEEANDYGELFGDIAPLYEILNLKQPGYLGVEEEIMGRSLELLLAPFSGESQGGVLVVIHDVTEQRKNEEMHKEFVANVSHELRTPLTNIRSYAETLEENDCELPSETRKSFLNVILNESDRMTHIVQDLLTLSRFDSGRSPLNLTSFSIAEALRDAYNAVLLDAQHHEHTLTLQLDDSLPEITADRERILQVIMNILSNSIKYTPNGGSISIRAGTRGSWVWMEVADNGIGVPLEDRDHIFERFYRVDKARSRESGGTGLGLSIAKEIIDRHHGRIGVVGHTGPGLTILMELTVEGPAYDEV